MTREAVSRFLSPPDRVFWPERTLVQLVPSGGCMPASARPPLALLTLLVAVGLVVAVEAFSPNDTPEIQLQLGNLLYADGRYSEALTAFELAVGSPESRVRVPARIGLVQSALRIGSFQKARAAAEVLREEQPSNAFALAVFGDAMWSAGLFDEAEAGYQAGAGRRARTRHGATTASARVLSRPRPLRRGAGARPAGGPARAPRGGLPPHARQRLRAARPVRPRRHGPRELHQPAPEGPDRQPRRSGRSPNSSS